jgi:OOP family OmpA-OmpF porin
MARKILTGLTITCATLLMAACSQTPYQPVAATVPPLETQDYAPKVANFVVLLDSSGSMQDEYGGRPKSEIAQDTVATFNAAVPDLPFTSGLTIFGKGERWCVGGSGEVFHMYGLAEYDKAKFADALGAIQCAANNTPIADALDATATQFEGEDGEEIEGPTAVYIVSDFVWNDPDSAAASFNALKTQLGDSACFHMIKVGDYSENDGLIASMNSRPGCDTASSASDLASGEAMGAFAMSTLMAPLQYERHQVSATALFDFDRYVVKPEGKAEIANLAAMIMGSKTKVHDINVIGHTDSKGSESYNQRLSERRAQAVTALLVAAGVDASIIDTSGMGEMQPVASNDTEEGRARNRRVEVHVGTSVLKSD